MAINTFVYVIESPGAEDLLDGRTEGNCLCEALRLSNTPYWYSLATTEATFARSLNERLQQAWETHRAYPVLHFSMHSDEQGRALVLTDGTQIRWKELTTYLSHIYAWTQGQLLVCMSVCSGARAGVMALHKPEEPTYWALVGNTEAVSWSDATVAYVAFYHNLFRGRDLDDCVRRMRCASGNEDFMRVFSKDAREHQKSLQLPSSAPSPGVIGQVSCRRY